MGKSGKKTESHRHGRGRRASRFRGSGGDEDGGELPSSAYDAPLPHQEDSDGDDTDEAATEDEHEEDVDGGDQHQQEVGSMPSKFHLYQLSVQSPKGDISYLQKFFLIYVGGRVPLHLQEDFCGTALLSTEWLRTDARRTAVGLDLDLESLEWCLGNNLSKIGADGYSRILLFHGNVLQPNGARLVKQKISDIMQNLHVNNDNGSLASKICDQSDPASSQLPANSTMLDVDFPARDIICAFNYSCCCLHRRKDLVLYFKHAFNALSKRGGIFVVDVYGGTSSERKLRLQRRFPSFTYFWEQEEFDIISRQTRISLHFQAGKKQMLRHAFTYHWRL
ncbi:hypothetical protein E2562_032164 [Oryza meyeriana var. granulata]|nr:hypothetical protein E2562_032164 [Oryza meyeriana var. granulata]